MYICDTFILYARVIYIPNMCLFTTVIGKSLIGGIILLSSLPKHKRFSFSVAMCVYSSKNIRINNLRASQYNNTFKSVD